MKRMLTLLTVLMIIIASAVFMADASGSTVYCERCNQDVSEDDWQEWDFISGDVTGGHYRLTDDFFSQVDTIRIPENNIVCLDLNGYTYSTGKIRTFNVAGTLTIMDSKGDGLILSTGKASTYGGFALVQSSGTFKLYGGTVRYSAVPNVDIYSGGLFYIDGGRMDIYDGATVAGGVAQALSSTVAQGGNIAVQSNGVLYIHGGTIKEGLALKSSSKTAQGGNIYVNGGGKVVISDGVIENGYTDAGGGNIFVADGTLEVNGGIIRNGHALVSGGNIMANANTDVVNSVTITGGIAGGTYGTYENDTFTRGTKGGGNIYERSPGGILNITGGTIDGDIVLDTANAKGLTEGAEIYVQASRVFTKPFDSADDAQAALAYFKGAVRTAVIKTDTNTLLGEQGSQGYCPHCQQLVTWKNLNTDGTFSDHSYLSSSLIRTSNLSVSSSWVLDLNGYTLHQENRRFIFNYNSAELSLTILDSWGGGRLQGSGTGNAEGGLLYIWPNSTFELLSGSLCVASTLKDTTPIDIIVKTGGVIHAANKAKISITGGVISGGSVTAADGCGGNICMNSTAGNLLVTGGIIKSGKATGLNGGNIYSKSPVEISGSVIMGGAAGNGGNLYTTGVCEIRGGTIIKGNATVNGGNLYPYGSADIKGGLIEGGIATTAGGNIGVYGAEVDISDDSVIIGGFATSRGGNIGVGSEATLHISGGLISTGYSDTRAGNIDQATETAATNIDGGMIVAGNAPVGGNLYINNGKLNMTGGTIMGGASNAGGNIYLNYYVYAELKDDSNTSTPLPRISHGSAANGNGGNIYFTAADNGTKYYLNLGNCIVRDGRASNAGKNIYIHDKGVFKILSEFNQSTTVYLHASRNPVKGGLLTTGTNIAGGNYTGELRLENLEPNPLICAENGDLRVTASAVVLKDGSSLWYGNNMDAVSNYNDNAAYLIADAGELVLNGKSYVVDLAGQEVSITGSGTLTCFDSMNDNYKTFGSATINGPSLTNQVQTTVKNKMYVTVIDGENYSFHRLDMGVDSISIRPSNAGVYYGCTWNCDETLANNLKSFGVAISIDHMPTTEFENDNQVLYTRSTAADFVVGESCNSVLIANVLQKNNQLNDNRARTSIFATPYITMETQNGELQSIVALAVDQAQYSLYDVMKLVDDRIASDPTNFRRLTNPMRNFYEEWKNDGMQTWDLSKIPAPSEDDVIDVLMIGSSFCYYYVEELYGLAEAAGVKMRVCNVYYSGCKFDWHYTWWKQGKSNYEFYQVTDNTGRKKTNSVSLEYCLAQGAWDVISIQESTSTIYNAGAQNHLDATRAKRNELIGYLKDQFPEAKVYWHQPWSYQIGYKSGNKEVNTFEQQQERMMSIREFALGVCAENGVNRVNTGEAWQIYRKSYVGTNGLTDTLCARLGVGTNNVGDYYHDGDIDGGQYLNACVWFEIIMRDLRPQDNITCIGNTYDPVYSGKYKLSQQLRTALQESAHQAVLEYDWETPSTEGEQ